MASTGKPLLLQSVAVPSQSSGCGQSCCRWFWRWHQGTGMHQRWSADRDASNTRRAALSAGDMHQVASSTPQDCHPISESEVLQLPNKYNIRICLDHLLIEIRLITLLCDHSQSKTRLMVIINLIGIFTQLHAMPASAQLHWTVWVSVVTAASTVAYLGSLAYCATLGSAFDRNQLLMMSWSMIILLSDWGLPYTTC